MSSRSLIFMSRPVVLGNYPEITMSRIHNFSYTVPTEGRIAIGERAEFNGQRLPRRLNHFLITGQHQRDGHFVEHPVAALVAKATDQATNAICEIPIKLMFNDTDLTVRQRWEAVNPKVGRLICAGDGAQARRMVEGKIEACACPGADHCTFAQTEAICRSMTRMNLQIDVPGDENYEPDALSSFLVRSAGMNTARTLSAKLKHLSALLGGNLIGVPLALKLRQKSSPISHYSIFYYIDVVLRRGTSIVEAARLGREHARMLKEAEVEQEAYESAVREGIANGPFEDASEDFAEAAEYFDLGDLGTGDERGAADMAVGQAFEQEVGQASGEAGARQDPMAWLGLTAEYLQQTQPPSH